MKTWRMNGSPAMAVAPSAVVGRHVAPAEQRLPFGGDDLRELRLKVARRGVAGRKTMPTPYSPGGGSAQPQARRLAAKNVGHLQLMPAPSPVFGSQPHAPRWLRFSSTVMRLGARWCATAGL
jgi:hypothetical protein